MQLGAKKVEIKNGIDSALIEAANFLGLEQKNVKLEFTQQHGYTYRVTMKDEKVLRKKNRDLIIVDTNKSGVKFRDRALDRLNREFLAVNSEFEEQQKDVLKQVAEITCGYASIFSSVGSILSRLDVLVGFSVAAGKNNVFKCTTVSKKCEKQCYNFQIFKNLVGSREAKRPLHDIFQILHLATLTSYNPYSKVS